VAITVGVLGVRIAAELLLRNSRRIGMRIEQFEKRIEPEWELQEQRSRELSQLEDLVTAVQADLDRLQAEADALSAQPPGEERARRAREIEAELAKVNSARDDLISAFRAIKEYTEAAGRLHELNASELAEIKRSNERARKLLRWLEIVSGVGLSGSTAPRDQHDPT